jgi:sugar lactone lactonase YvrE
MRWVISLPLLALAAACGRLEAPAAAPTPSATVETFVRGGAIDGANGLIVGPDRRLYVASVVSAGIFVLDLEDGHLIERLGPDEGVRNPDDVDFAGDGTLCWTDTLDGNVGCRLPGGTGVVAARLGAGVNALTFADDGRLFVSQCFAGSKVFEVDSRGVHPARLIRDDLGPNCGLNGMDWGPDGRLYGARWFNGEVVRIDVDTGADETVATGFGTPAAVKFDSQGRLHVLDTLRGQVVRLDGAEQSVVAQLTPGLDNLAFDADDRLFVSSFVDGFVAEVVGRDALRTLSLGGLSMPGGVAAVGGTLFVADVFSLRRFDLASGNEGPIVRDVPGFSALGTVLSLQADGAELVMSSWNDRDIRIFDPAADTRSAKFGGRGRPIDALRFGDEIVYTEFDRGTVTSFALSAPDIEAERFYSDALPAGLAGADGDLFVAEHRSGRVLKLAEGGRWLAAPAKVADGLEGPEGMLVRDGVLYVVEAATGSLARIDLRDGMVRRIASGLAVGTAPQAPVPQTWIFSGITADDAGRLYVGGERDNLIHRIVVSH